MPSLLLLSYQISSLSANFARRTSDQGRRVPIGVTAQILTRHDTNRVEIKYQQETRYIIIEQISLTRYFTNDDPHTKDIKLEKTGLGQMKFLNSVTGVSTVNRLALPTCQSQFSQYWMLETLCSGQVDSSSQTLTFPHSCSRLESFQSVLNTGNTERWTNGFKPLNISICPRIVLQNQEICHIFCSLYIFKVKRCRKDVILC